MEALTVRSVDLTWSNKRMESDGQCVVRNCGVLTLDRLVDQSQLRHGLPTRRHLAHMRPLSAPFKKENERGILICWLSFSLFIPTPWVALQLTSPLRHHSRSTHAGEDAGDRPTVAAAPSSSATLNPKLKFLNMYPTYFRPEIPNPALFLPKPLSNDRIGVPKENTNLKPNPNVLSPRPTKPGSFYQRNKPKH